MAVVDPGATLARLDEAYARLRAAHGTDDVLDVLADEARAIAGVTHAWAAHVDGDTISPMRGAAAGSAPHVESPASNVARLLAAARPIARGGGLTCAALMGSSGKPAGVLALPHAPSSTPADDAALDLVLAPLAAVAGLALECAVLRARVAGVARGRELLLGCVSHDLRNPLNTFAMSTGLLRDDLERNDVDLTRGLGLVARMERASARMQGIIEDLVEASRIDARTIDFVIGEHSASQLLDDAVAAASTAATDRLPSVTREASDEDAVVVVDRKRTLQLVAKVVAFEAKCAGDAGTIRLSLARAPQAVRITARANGGGGKQVARVAEDRADLALLIARGLAEAQGGTFRIEPGEGLAISFTLPAATSLAATRSELA